jgi:DNA polymerase III epsilon subunit-like protein
MSRLVHNWGDLVAVVDVETTGLDPYYHEIVQLTIIVLDSNFNPMKEIIPFDIYMRPNFIERIDKSAMEVNGISLKDLINIGIDSESAKDLLNDWFYKLPLDMSSINHKRLRPIGHNYKFDYSFLVSWLGSQNYDMLFHYHHRDTMSIVEFINDMYAMKGENVPFSKRSLTDVCRVLDVKRERAHNSLDDCYATAECYRKLVTNQYWAKTTLV